MAGFTLNGSSPAAASKPRMAALVAICMCTGAWVCSTPAGAQVLDERAPSYPGASVQSLSGQLKVDGRPTAAAVFQTSDKPETVISFFRRNLASLPVDLVELPVPGGLLLSALDNRRGRRLVVEAIQREGTTFVTWGWSEPSAQPDPEGGGLPFPSEILWLTRVDDALGGTSRSTRTGFTPLPPSEIGQKLARSFADAGWSRGSLPDGAQPMRWEWVHGKQMGEALLHPTGGGTRIEFRLSQKE